MVFKGQDDNLFKKFVAHQELFARSRDISISVLDSHTSESGLLNLKSNASCQIKVNLSFL